MIKDIIEESIRKLNAQKETAVASAVKKNLEDVITPEINKMEQEKNNAIKEIQVQANSKINEITKSYSESKDKMIADGEQAVRASTGAVYESEIAVFQSELSKLNGSEF